MVFSVIVHYIINLQVHNIVLFIKLKKTADVYSAYDSSKKIKIGNSQNETLLLSINTKRINLLQVIFLNNFQVKGIGGNTFFWNLILFYIVFTKLQDAFYRFKKIQNNF